MAVRHSAPSSVVDLLSSVDSNLPMAQKRSRNSTMQVGAYSVSGVKTAYAGVQRHRRILFSIPLTLRHLMHGGVRASRGISLDISESGIGALVEGGLHVGDTVEIDLQLPDWQLNAVAIVRHTSSIRSGFEFFGLTADERVQLAAIVGRA